MAGSSLDDPGRREQLAVLAVIVLAVAAIYGPTVGHEWQREGDRAWILENPTMALPLGPVALWHHLSEPVGPHWAPLSALSLHLNQVLGAGEPAGTHWTNAALHALTSCLLFRLLWSLTGGFYTAAFVAILFAVHPLQVESVAWATQRQNVLGALFLVLGLSSHASGVSRGHGRLRVAAWLLLAMLSKPTLAVAPLALLLLDYWPLARFTRDDGSVDPVRLRACLVEKLPLLLLGAGVASLALFFQTFQTEPFAQAFRYPLPLRISGALNGLLVYLSQSVLPRGLAMPQLPPALNWQGALGAVALGVGVSAVAWGFRRDRPYILFGWLWFLLFLAPVLGLVQIDTAAHADRYAYLPIIGLAVAFAWGAAQAVKEMPGARTGFLVASLLVLGWFGIQAAQQRAVWRNAESLYAAALKTTGPNPRAQMGLGQLMMEAGRYKEAVVFLSLATQSWPGWMEAQLATADAFVATGELDSAIYVYEYWIERAPDPQRPRRSLGLALVAAGRGAEALPHLRSSLEAAPDDPELRAALDGLAEAP